MPDLLANQIRWCSCRIRKRWSRRGPAKRAARRPRRRASRRCPCADHQRVGAGLCGDRLVRAERRRKSTPPRSSTVSTQRSAKRPPTQRWSGASPGVDPMPCGRRVQGLHRPRHTEKWAKVTARQHQARMSRRASTLRRSRRHFLVHRRCSADRFVPGAILWHGPRAIVGFRPAAPDILARMLGGGGAARRRSSRTARGRRVDRHRGGRQRATRMATRWRW